MISKEQIPKWVTEISEIEQAKLDIFDSCIKLLQDFKNGSWFSQLNGDTLIIEKCISILITSKNTQRYNPSWKEMEYRINEYNKLNPRKVREYTEKEKEQHEKNKLDRINHQISLIPFKKFLERDFVVRKEKLDN